MTDDEPYPSSYTDCTYSQWRVNEGTTLFTIKSSEKVDEFEFDYYFRPQYQPGWKIKEEASRYRRRRRDRKKLGTLLTPFCRPQSQKNI